MLTWDGDNSDFVIGWLIPRLNLRTSDKEYMIMAYKSGAEMTSDGKTFVEDTFMNGVIKSPDGVTHDYINRVHNHTTPDGKKWTVGECNALFRRIQKALWQHETKQKRDLNWVTRTLRWIKGFRRRWRQWLGVTVSSPWWWQ